jgi:hypothetical protein
LILSFKVTFTKYFLLHKKEKFSRIKLLINKGIRGRCGVMPMRDLQYPEDAERLLENLNNGLKYDAAFAVFGNILQNIPQSNNQPKFNVGIMFFEKENVDAIQRDAVGLCPRFSLISMISRFEVFTRNLLLQRRVLEELKTEGVKMTPTKMWEILINVYKDTKKSISRVILELLVTNPSTELTNRTNWLVGISRVRNCLAHRLGIVQIEDLKMPGTPIETIKDVKETDTLKVGWLRLKVIVDGKEIKSFPYKVTGEGKGNFEFEIYEREWKIRDVIQITPQECQYIAMSLRFLGGLILSEFEVEMNKFLSKFKSH